MNLLKEYYNCHCCYADDFDSLNDKQKKIIKNSTGYAMFELSYYAGQLNDSIHVAFQEVVDQISSLYRRKYK